MPPGQPVGPEAERFQDPQGVGGQAIAAALVAREAGSVDEEDVATGAGQLRGSGRARRAGPDHDHVGRQQSTPSAGRYVACTVSTLDSLDPSAVRVRSVVTRVQLPTRSSDCPVCSAVTVGVDHRVTVMLLPV